MAIKNTNLGGTDWADGETLEAADLNDTFDAAVPIGANTNPTISPVGAVVAWLKSYTNTPATLPFGWVECNGQVLSDSASPYNGQTLPDLNNTVAGGSAGQFLRGSTVSGTIETSQNLSHTHSVPHSRTGGANGGKAGGYSSNIPATLTTAASGGSEARPNSYSVVWIMRVK